MSTETRQGEGVEFTVLQRYGVRWAVLAAWHADLVRLGMVFEPDFPGKLDAARTKIATGTFSTCTVGCALGEIEGTLVSSAATLDPQSVDAWLEKLGQAMSRPDAVAALIDVPAIRAQYVKCGFLPCDCKE